MDSAVSNTNEATASAADIVVAALKREGINPSEMGIFGGGYLNLLKGRPHITIGFRTLLENPLALLIALWQTAFMYVVVHEATQFFKRGHDTIWLHHIPRTAWFGIERLDTVVFFFLAASIPFLVLNLGWGLMAAAIVGRFRPAVLLSGLTGIVPLRAFAGSLMPKWWFFQVEWRLNIALAARILQFSWAYKLATGRNKAEVEMDWARALDRHTKPLLDGMLSYAIQPILVSIALLLAVVAISYIFNLDLLFNAINDVFKSIHFSFSDSEEFIAPFFSFFALVGAWLAFERACLGAMVFRFLSESDTQHHQQTRSAKLGILALACVFTLLFGFIWRWVVMVNKDAPPPASGLLWAEPALHAAGHEFYGAMGLIAPSSETGYFYVVIENEQGMPVTKLFLRPGDAVYFPVPAGKYITKAFHGAAWKGNYIFGFDTVKVADNLEFVCPHYRLWHLNTHAVAGPEARFCAEHKSYYMDISEFDKYRTETTLLCGPQIKPAPIPTPTYPVEVADRSYPVYLAGAFPNEITCNMPIKSMGHSHPIGITLEALSIPGKSRVCCRITPPT